MVFQDDRGIKARAIGEYQVQRAVKRALDKKTVREQLSRLGGTPFELAALELEWDDHVFIPVSVLNQLRRDAIHDLIQKRIEYYDNKAVSKGRMNSSLEKHSIQVDPRLSGYFTECKTPSPPLLNGYVDHLDFQPGDLEGLDILSYAPASFCFRFESLTRQS